MLAVGRTQTYFRARKLACAAPIDLLKDREITYGLVPRIFDGRDRLPDLEQSPVPAPVPDRSVPMTRGRQFTPEA